MNVQFLHESLTVFLHCLGADAELESDSLIWQTSGDELQDFLLARAQLESISCRPAGFREGSGLLFLDVLCDFRAVKRPTAANRPDRLSKLISGTSLAQITGGACLGHLRHGIRIVRRAQYQNFGVGNGLENLPRGLQAIE